MKLIIDVPNEEYKTLSKMSEKEKVNELSYYEKIIANGIPYEPKGWNPVSKSLPENKGYFLTSTVFNDVYCDFWNGEEFERTEMILAWMPLPKPYTKEDSDT